MDHACETSRNTAERMDEGNGVLAVWNDVDPAHEDEFNDWYRRDHLPDRLAVPGFEDARRCVALAGGPRYAAFYTTRDLAVLSSAAYLERLQNPTDWTRRVMPWFRRMTRSACTIAASHGRGIGAYVGCMWLGSGAAPETGEQLSAAVFPDLMGDPSLVRIQLWVADPERSQMQTAEAALRGAPDAMAARVVVIDGLNEQAVERACELTAHEAALRGHAAQCPPAIYRLLCYFPSSVERRMFFT